MRKLAIVLLCCCAGSVHAQGLLRYEPFDYTPAGDPILGKTNPDGETWEGAFQGGVAPANITVGSGSLAMPLELGLGVGNSADINFSNASVATAGNNNGKSVRLGLVEPGQPITTGAVYYSFALRVDDITGVTTGTGGFFIGLNNSLGSQATNPTAATARVQAHVDPLDPAKYELSVVRNRGVSSVADIPVWSGGMTVGETHFIVAAVEIVEGLQNDIARLWINPGDLGAETAPAATITDATTGVGTDFNIASILLRQAPHPSLTLDELRVGTTWASVTSAESEPEEDADFDDDLDVDGEDFLIWQRGVGALGSGTNATGDANDDTNVDELDLAIWEADFGPAATPNANAIPEPASLAMAVLALGTVLCGATSVGRRRTR